MPLLKRYGLSLCTVLVVATGCASSQPAIRAAPNFLRRQAGPTPAQAALVEEHCPGGAPKLLQSVQHGPVQLVAHKGYVLEHSSIDKIARWVCEKVTWAQVQGKLERSDTFRPDPLLKPGQRAELSDYERTGYDRGHMAPAGDQTVDPVLKDETFYLSNMAPQIGVGFNRGTWRFLEDWARGKATQQAPVYIITGGFFYDPAEDKETTADGTIPYRTIGAGAVAVPTHFYKIVARQDADGEWEAIAFVLENRKQSADAFWTAIKPIRWIEERAGIDFFPDLDAGSSTRIEEAKPSLWQ